MRGAILKEGDRFNRLVILRAEDTDKTGHIRWVCQCDCGNEHIVRSDKLTSGRIKSCGCLQIELVAAAREAKRKNFLLKEEIRSEAYRLKYQGKLKRVSKTFRGVKDYQNLDYTGSPKLAADWFLSWAYQICRIMRAGPDRDSINVQVRITVNNEEQKKRAALALLEKS